MTLAGIQRRSEHHRVCSSGIPRSVAARLRNSLHFDPDKRTSPQEAAADFSSPKAVPCSVRQFDRLRSLRRNNHRSEPQWSLSRTPEKERATGHAPRVPPKGFRGLRGVFGNCSYSPQSILHDGSCPLRTARCHPDDLQARERCSSAVAEYTGSGEAGTLTEEDQEQRSSGRPGDAHGQCGRMPSLAVAAEARRHLLEVRN